MKKGKGDPSRHNCTGPATGLSAGGRSRNGQRMVTLVPRGVFSKKVLAMSAGSRTHPWLTGYPVSHGCVRLPADMAKTFFENTPLGTKVTIR